MKKKKNLPKDNNNNIKAALCDSADKFSVSSPSVAKMSLWWCAFAKSVLKKGKKNKIKK